MGAWGHTAFENDSAMDWLAEFERQGVPALRDILSLAAETAEDDYLDVDDGASALAAAEIVAAALGQGRDRVPRRVGSWLDANAGAIVEEDMELASRAVERVLSDSSELRDLWDENGPHAGWRADVEALLIRLGGNREGNPPKTVRTGDSTPRLKSARARKQADLMKTGLLMILRMRGLEPTEEQLDRISATNDDAEIRSWAARVMEAVSVEEVLSGRKT